MPPHRLGISDPEMHQGLLVTTLHERHQVAQLVQRLPHAGDVPVTEDAESCGDQPTTLPIRNRILLGNVGDHGLGDGQPDRASRSTVTHRSMSPERPHGTRGKNTNLLSEPGPTKDDRGGRSSSPPSSRRRRSAAPPCRYHYP